MHGGRGKAVLELSGVAFLRSRDDVDLWPGVLDLVPAAATVVHVRQCMNGDCMDGQCMDAADPVDMVMPHAARLVSTGTWHCDKSHRLPI